MLCLFQLAVQFRSLDETSQHRVQWGQVLRGLCCDDTKVYCVEGRLKDGSNTYWLTVYDMGGAENGSLTLLDKVEMQSSCMCSHPRVDSSRRVYVPCSKSGVRVFLCRDRRLLPARDPLTCVWDARSVCGDTADTVFVCDWDTRSVFLVNVSSDTVIRQLERPARFRGYPKHVSLLGQTVLVWYGTNTLVTYRRDSSTPCQLLQTPEELKDVTSITTDSRSSSFLVTGNDSVFVLDDKLLWHRIYTGALYMCDCDMDQSHLWLGYDNGDIAVLTSQ